MNRAYLQQLSRLRVREARILLDNRCYPGAYYLLGYAVECALKACFARQIQRFSFPDRKLVNDSYTHDLEKLLSISGVKNEFESETRLNIALAANWVIVRDWSEISRYDSEIPEATAKNFHSAATARRNGVLSWLMRRW